MSESKVGADLLLARMSAKGQLRPRNSERKFARKIQSSADLRRFEMAKFLKIVRIVLVLGALVAPFLPAGQVQVARADPEQKVDVCHFPPGNPANAHVINIGVSAVPVHLAHGDFVMDEDDECPPPAPVTPAPTATPDDEDDDCDGEDDDGDGDIDEDEECPTPTSTSAPSTSTPTAQPTDSPTNTPAPTDTPDPTATNTPGPTATNTPGPTVTPCGGSCTPTSTATPTNTPTVTNTPTASSTPIRTPDPLPIVQRLAASGGAPAVSVTMVTVHGRWDVFGLAMFGLVLSFSKRLRRTA